MGAGAFTHPRGCPPFSAASCRRHTRPEQGRGPPGDGGGPRRSARLGGRWPRRLACVPTVPDTGVALRRLGTSPDRGRVLQLSCSPVTETPTVSWAAPPRSHPHSNGGHGVQRRERGSPGMCPQARSVTSRSLSFHSQTGTLMAPGSAGHGAHQAEAACRTPGAGPGMPFVPAAPGSEHTPPAGTRGP